MDDEDSRKRKCDSSNHMDKRHKFNTERGYIAITDSTKHKIIDEYKKHPCLWDLSVDDYQDRSSILDAKIKIGKLIH